MPDFAKMSLRELVRPEGFDCGCGRRHVCALKYLNIGILITDHNVDETLAITDRAYLLFEGRILFQGTPEELAANEIVRKKYLTESFELRKKNFQLQELDRKHTGEG